METNVYIGKRLKTERERLRFRQEDLAYLGGITRQTQSKYEKGTRSPDANYLSRVAAVGVDIKYVITGSDSPSCEKSEELVQGDHTQVSNARPSIENELQLSPDELEWIKWYKQMHQDDRKHIKVIVQRFAEQGKKDQESTDH